MSTFFACFETRFFIPYYYLVLELFFVVARLASLVDRLDFDCLVQFIIIPPLPKTHLVTAFTAGTSSSSGKMSGTGPTGVMANGLICAWLLV